MKIRCPWDKVLAVHIKFYSVWESPTSGLLWHCRHLSIGYCLEQSDNGLTRCIHQYPGSFQSTGWLYLVPLYFITIYFILVNQMSAGGIYGALWWKILKIFPFFISSLSLNQFHYLGFQSKDYSMPKTDHPLWTWSLRDKLTLAFEVSYLCGCLSRHNLTYRITSKVSVIIQFPLSFLYQGIMNFLAYTGI